MIDTAIAAALAATLARIAASDKLSEAEKPATSESAWKAAAELRKLARAVEGQPWRREGRDVLFLSASEARRGLEVWHRTTAQGCDCRGYASSAAARRSPMGRALVLAMPVKAAEPVVEFCPGPPPPVVGRCPAPCGQGLVEGLSWGGEEVLECVACGRAYQIAPIAA